MPGCGEKGSASGRLVPPAVSLSSGTPGLQHPPAPACAFLLSALKLSLSGPSEPTSSPGRGARAAGMLGGRRHSLTFRMGPEGASQASPCLCPSHSRCPDLAPWFPWAQCFSGGKHGVWELLAGAGENYVWGCLGRKPGKECIRAKQRPHREGDPSRAKEGDNQGCT